MGQVDVSDLVIDPVFTNSLQLIHRTSVVNSFGENTLTENVIDTIGVIQPANSKDLERIPESLRMHDMKKFYVKTEVLIDGASQYPDIIVYGGNRYQVIQSMVWLNFGAGWNKAICVAEKVTL